MAEFPSLPLFTDSWVADTKHLSRLERGTYHDLLVLMWRTPECRVPNDDAWLAKRLNMTSEEVRDELRPIITEFCKTDGNHIFQKRLRKEWMWCRRKSKKQSDNAKARWDKEKDICQSDATTSPVGNAPTPTPTPTKKEEDPPSAGRRPAAFESGVIRLTQKDLDQWIEAFSHLDVKAELLALTEWAQKQQNWFMAVSGALAKRNRAAHERLTKPTKPAHWREAIV